jgi:bifunctional DNA-binding transcriptional regulator/antitoxin component of YhaV-PrlF toxin-antitoxin module
MTTMTMSSKGWIVIPKEYRTKYGFAPGRKVAFVDYAGVLSILPVPDDPVAEGLGILRRFTADTSLTEALLRERAADREREEAELDTLRA